MGRTGITPAVDTAPCRVTISSVCRPLMLASASRRLSRAWGPQQARVWLAGVGGRLALAGPLAFSLLVCIGCGRNSADTGPVVAVQAITAEKTTIQRNISADAVLSPLQQAAITPKISAPVRTFYVRRGSRVHKGQLLVVLENRDLEAAKEENKGAYEQAQAAYETTTAASLPEELQKAALDVQAAKKSLDAQEKVYHSREELFQQGALPRKELDQAGVDLTNARNQYEI